jgi:hypothetical protein
MCVPVHVGEIAVDNGGAESDRIAVVATPLIAERPIVAVGLANPAMPPGQFVPLASQTFCPLTVSDVPETETLPPNVEVPVPANAYAGLSIVFPS